MKNIEIPKEALMAGVSGDYYDKASNRYVCVSFGTNGPVVVGAYENNNSAIAMGVVSVFVWTRHYGGNVALMNKDIQCPN